MLTVVTLLNHKYFKDQNVFSFFQKTSSMKLNFMLVQQGTQNLWNYLNDENKRGKINVTNANSAILNKLQKLD